VKMDRRTFLDPRHLTHSAGQLLGAADAVVEALDPPDAPLDQPLLHLGWRAMATQWEIILPLSTPDATDAGQAAFALLDEIEARLTVYRPSSEVSRLNAAASFADVEVSAELFDLLTLASEVHAETHGAFDITAGALIKAWGFYKGPRRVPADGELSTALARTGMQHVRLDGERRSVRFATPGLEINLGAIGKGWALDRLTELLSARWKIGSALLHGGRSSVYGMGCPPGEHRGWVVGLSHPEQPERRLARVRLRDRAMATSAATYQYLEHQGRKLGHVLDPRTGWSASGVACCSVLAPTSALADALSTAFFILGLAPAREFCQRHPEIGVLLLLEGADELIAVGPVPELE
jgi:thiamine biosynthesis lipoprotein